MPVVNTVVDRLKEITSRVNPRESLQNTKQRLQTSYAAMSVGNAVQVQEFYKYIKVYPQCPANDLLFMNMTAQLSRAAMFPTDKMFKQMWKLEKHMDTLLMKEGIVGVYGSRAIEILACQNHKFILKFRKYKHKQEKKRFVKESKKSKKDAKVLAAVRDARIKARCSELKQEVSQNELRSNYVCVKVVPPVQVLAPQPDHLAEMQEVLPMVDLGVKEVVDSPPDVPCSTPDGTDPHSILKQKLAAPEMSNPQLEALLTDMVAKIITKNKLEFLEENLEDPSSESDEDDEEEEEDRLPTCGFHVGNPEEVMAVQEDSEDDEIEKIEEIDVEALEYEML